MTLFMILLQMFNAKRAPQFDGLREPPAIPFLSPLISCVLHSVDMPLGQSENFLSRLFRQNYNNYRSTTCSCRDRRLPLAQSIHIPLRIRGGKIVALCRDRINVALELWI